MALTAASVPQLQALASFLEASNMLSMTLVATQNEAVTKAVHIESTAGRFREMIDTPGYNGDPATVAAIFADRFSTFADAFMDAARTPTPWPAMSSILRDVERIAQQDERDARTVIGSEQNLIARREGFTYEIRMMILQVG
jgi:hypothetical protein